MNNDTTAMETSDDEAIDNNVKLLAYEKMEGKEGMAPLATLEEQDHPPTPPLPPAQSESDTEKAVKVPYNALLVEESSRPKPVRGTTRLVSSLYAKLLVAATAILLTTEILPNRYPMFFFHGYLFSYLIGAAILCILCIYMGLLLRSCPGMQELEEESSYEGESILRKKSSSLPEISIFFRVGALVFGLGALIAIGLEAATLFTMEEPCVDKVNFIQPLLHALFTFMQMHFLSLNSQKAIQYLGWCRHLVLMHLVATNIAIWLRLTVWETAKSWLDDTHIFVNATNAFPPEKHNVTAHAIFSDGRHQTYMSPSCVWLEQEEKIEDILRLRHCYRNTTIGIIWDKAQPFIIPFIVQFCLVGAAVSYILWANMGNRRRKMRKTSSWTPQRQDNESLECGPRRVDCKGSSKGLFLGLLVFAVGIVVLILFFILTNNPHLKEETLFVTVTVHCSILGLALLGALLGICRVGGMCTEYGRRHDLDEVLQNIGVFAVYVHGICSIIVGVIHLRNTKNLVLFIDGILMIVHSLLQSVFFHKIAQKCCSIKCKHEGRRPGRQVVTFLAFANLVLWVIESFTDHSHASSDLQLKFFGNVTWGLISRLFLPLVVFYRFHSSVYLMEVWKSGYNLDN